MGLPAAFAGKRHKRLGKNAEEHYKNMFTRRMSAKLEMMKTSKDRRPSADAKRQQLVTKDWWRKYLPKRNVSFVAYSLKTVPVNVCWLRLKVWPLQFHFVCDRQNCSIIRIRIMRASDHVWKWMFQSLWFPFFSFSMRS